MHAEKPHSKPRGRPFTGRGDPRNGHGKKGRSGRPRKAFKLFCRETIEDPDVQDGIIAKAKGGDAALVRLLAEHGIGVPEQTVRLKGSDALERLLSRLAGLAAERGADGAPGGAQPG